ALPQHRAAQLGQPLDDLSPALRSNVEIEMYAVLDRLRLGHDLEQHPAAQTDAAVRIGRRIRVAYGGRLPARQSTVHCGHICLTRLPQFEQERDERGVVLDNVLERLGPERGQLVWIRAVDADFVCDSHGMRLSTSSDRSSVRS